VDSSPHSQRLLEAQDVDPAASLMRGVEFGLAAPAWVDDRDVNLHRHRHTPKTTTASSRGAEPVGQMRCRPGLEG